MAGLSLRGGIAHIISNPNHGYEAWPHMCECSQVFVQASLVYVVVSLCECVKFVYAAVCVCVSVLVSGQ